MGKEGDGAGLSDNNLKRRLEIEEGIGREKKIPRTVVSDARHGGNAQEVERAEVTDELSGSRSRDIFSLDERRAVYLSAGCRTLAMMVSDKPEIASQAEAVGRLRKELDKSVIGGEKEYLEDYINSGKEPTDGLRTVPRFVNDMREAGYSDVSIIATVNIDMFPDSSTIQNRDLRMEEIERRGLVGNIVAYVDERISDSNILVSLEEARENLLKEEMGEEFVSLWFTYYKSVEEYLMKESQGKFDPSDPKKDITDKRISENVDATVEVQSS